jgi:hypothetical protein
MILQFHPAARTEAVEATDWYEQAAAGLGARFTLAYQDALDQIRSRGAQYAMAEGYRGRHNVRRVRMTGFPYSIIYRCYPDRAQIIAVAHASRRPNYWRNRIS